jgi:uncharacterized protein
MAGTKAGGAKASQTIRERDPDYYRRIGAMGGKVKNPKKGFGSDDRTVLDKILLKRKRASLAGKRGGTISRRGKQPIWE